MSSPGEASLELSEAVGVPPLVLLVPVAAIMLVVFLASPFSVVLNAITVPLGYEWQSCPYCPAMGLEKIEYAHCRYCGDEHATNFGASKYQNGQRIPFCSNECLDHWKTMEDYST